MTITVASIAAKAFNAVAAKVGGVIQTGILSRITTSNYEPTSGDYKESERREKCRVVFSRADAGQKYFPDTEIASPDDLIFIEGAQGMPPQKQDKLIIGERRYLLTHDPRDILQANGLWAAIVRPL